MERKSLTHSWLNPNLPFADYIEAIKSSLKAGRKDLTPDNTDQIVEANSPFELKPQDQTIRGGILLIHGLYDSPFSVRDCANHLVSQGYWVKAILLPGHGTQPEDLFRVSHQDWTAVVSYGVQSFQNQVEKVFLLGFSLGGALALYEAYQNPKVAGLLLFAPAIKSIRKYASYAGIINYIARFIKALRWYQKNPQKSYAKYESFSSNAAAQALTIMKALQKKINSRPLNLPLFVVVSDDDETICVSSAYDFFKTEKNPHRQFIIYTRGSNFEKDPNVIVRSSIYPEERIVDFSHICLLISPKNSHYGRKGDYRDIHSIHNNFDEENNFSLGAASEQNIKKYSLQRLTYNPDYDWLMRQVDNFLNQT